MYCGKYILNAEVESTELNVASSGNGEQFIQTSFTQPPKFRVISSPNLHLTRGVMTDKLSTHKLKFRTKAVISRSRVDLVLQHFIGDYLIHHQRFWNSSSRYLIYWPPNSGLGDRLMGLIDAYWTAVVSNRILLIDALRSPLLFHILTSTVPGMNLFLQEKNIPPGLEMYRNVTDDNFRAFRVTSTTTAVSKIAENHLLSDAAIAIYQGINVNNHTLTFANVHCPSHVTANDLLSVRRRAILKRAVLKYVFSIQDHIRLEFFNEFDRLVDVFKLTIPPTKLLGSYVAVHARLGEGVQENITRFKRLIENKEIISKCLASMVINEQRSRNRIFLFLATDTPKFRRMFFNTVVAAYGEKVSLFFTDWIPHHVKNITDVRQGLHAAVIDMLFLGHASHIIALKSGYPIIAQAIGTAEELKLIDGNSCLS